MTPRGIRNHNPLNIELTGDQWMGLAGEQTDGRFAQFSRPEYGFRAAMKVLGNYQRKHGLNTPRQMIGRWAPAGENNVDAYVASVAKRSGLDPDAPVDLSRDGFALLEAMAHHENGVQPYSRKVIERGIQMAGISGGQGEDVLVGQSGGDYTLEQLQAEKARRQGYKLEDLLAERERRTAAPASPERSAPVVAGAGNSAQPYAEAATVMVNDLNAGFQGVNPVALAKSRPIGSVDRGQNGEIVAIDMDGVKEEPARFTPDKYVTRLDPESGLELLYMRTPEMDATVAESAGRLLGFGVPRTIGAPAAKAAQSASAAETIGVTPSLGMTGKAGAMAAAAGDAFVPAAGVMAKDATRAADEMASAAARIADDVGPGVSQADGGGALQRGADEFVDAFKAKSDELYSAVDAAIPKGAGVEVLNTAGELDRQLKVFADTPEIAKAIGLGKIQGWAKDVLSSGGKLSWEQIKALRSEIGSSIGNMKGPLADQADARLKSLYGALTKDMEAGAKAHGALGKWLRANAFYAKGQKRIDSALDVVFKSNSAEQAFERAFALTADKGGRANLAKLSGLKKSMPPYEWRSFVGTVIRRMGRPAAGAAEAADEVGFSASTFLASWSKMAPEARSVMFSGKDLPKTLRPALNALAEVSESAKQAGLEINRSRSGAVVGNIALGGAFASAPVTTTLTALLAHASARAMTQPGVVRALASFGRTGSLAGLKRLANQSGPAAVEAANLLRLAEQG